MGSRGSAEKRRSRCVWIRSADWGSWSRWGILEGLLEDTRGIQAVQRECRKGVKKGNSAVTNSGETPLEALYIPHKALLSLLQAPSHSSIWAQALFKQPISSFPSSPRRGKPRSKDKAVVVMWDTETVMWPAHTQWILEEEEEGSLPRQQWRMPKHEKINKQNPAAIKHCDTKFNLPYDFVWFYVFNGFLSYFLWLVFYGLPEHGNAAEL